MTINLYVNTSPTQQVTKDITLLGTVTGTLRASTSVLSPEITIEADLSDYIEGGLNYAYVEEFGRYYYVTNIVSENNTLWSVHLHVDVLMTYNTQIRAQTAVVARQENNWNLMLDDGWYMSYQNPLIDIANFSVANPFASESYVLVVAGN